MNTKKWGRIHPQKLKRVSWEPKCSYWTLPTMVSFIHLTARLQKIVCTAACQNWKENSIFHPQWKCSTIGVLKLDIKHHLYTKNNEYFVVTVTTSSHWKSFSWLVSSDDEIMNYNYLSFRTDRRMQKGLMVSLHALVCMYIWYNLRWQLMHSANSHNFSTILKIFIFSSAKSAIKLHWNTSHTSCNTMCSQVVSHNTEHCTLNWLTQQRDINTMLFQSF